MGERNTEHECNQPSSCRILSQRWTPAITVRFSLPFSTWARTRSTLTFTSGSARWSFMTSLRGRSSTRRARSVSKEPALDVSYGDKECATGQLAGSESCNGTYSEVGGVRASVTARDLQANAGGAYSIPLCSHPVKRVRGRMWRRENRLHPLPGPFPPPPARPRGSSLS